VTGMAVTGMAVTGMAVCLCTGGWCAIKTVVQ